MCIRDRKKPEYAVEAKSVLNDIQTALRLNISGVRILNRYDADKLSREDFEMSVNLSLIHILPP